MTTEILSKIVWVEEGEEEPTPDWAYGFEAADACSVHFDTVYGTPDCADTGHPSEGSHDVKFDMGTTEGLRKFFESSKTEVWIGCAIYIDSASPTTGYYIVIADNNFADELYFLAANIPPNKFRLRTLGNSTNYTGPTTMSGQTIWHIRLHFKMDNTNGEAHLASSLNGTDWTTEVSETGIDTMVGTATSLLAAIFGANNGSNLPENWYFDDIKIWYSDPGWSW